MSDKLSIIETNNQIITLKYVKCNRCKCHRIMPDEYLNKYKNKTLKTCIKCRNFCLKYRQKQAQKKVQ